MTLHVKGSCLAARAFFLFVLQEALMEGRGHAQVDFIHTHTRHFAADRIEVARRDWTVLADCLVREHADPVTQLVQLPQKRP
jgi:hypothetical protein